MKNVVRVNNKWIPIFHTLSRNQILLVFIRELGEEMDPSLTTSLLDEIYGYRKVRIKADMTELVKHKISKSNIKNGPGLKDLEPYFNIKIGTLVKAVQTGMSKQELLVLVWVLGLYRNWRTRVHEIKISDAVGTIYAHHQNPRKFRPIFLETIAKLEAWGNTGDFDELLIRAHEIRGAKIKITLTEKTTKRGKNMPKMVQNMPKMVQNMPKMVHFVPKMVQKYVDY